MFAEVFVVILITLTIICKMDYFGQAVPWFPKHANRSYLDCVFSWCPSNGSRLSDKLQSCCICKSRPVWYYPVDKTAELRLEYVLPNGESVVIADDQNITFPTVINTYGYMSKLPNNICSFNNILTLNISHNQFTEVGDLSCLPLLDILDLSYNRIRHISNDTFTKNGNLRVLYVTHNKIKSLDPATVNGNSLQIFHVDFSYNELEEVEFSNLISETDFCAINFSNNKIKKIINTDNFTINPNRKYHGGQVNLNGNKFTKFIKFEELGINDVTIFGKVLEYSFRMTDIKWDCDCHMEPYLEITQEIMKRVWREYFNLTCWNPVEYRGMSIQEIITKDKLHLLICNLTDNCPKNCHCFYQPKERRTVVDCNNANLTKLPKELPENNNLTLILTNNQITNFNYRPYLVNTSFLDISGNFITTVTKDAASALKPDIQLNLANNSIKSLPQELQTLDPCSSHFGEVKLTCDCNSAWLQQMAEKSAVKQCSDPSTFVCQTDYGDIPVQNIVQSEFCDEETSYQSIYMAIIFGLLASLLFGSAVSAYAFRFELYLIQRKYLYKFRKISNILPTMKYDVFLSFDEENDQLLSWVMNVLVFNLEASGYRVFVACRDLEMASVREEELIKCILKCQNSIVVLCNSYKLGRTVIIQKEWKYIWHTFLDFKDRNVIVVNYDQLESIDNMDARLRAFVRLGYDIDFSNRNHDLFSNIKQRLGKPVSESRSRNKAHTGLDLTKLNENIPVNGKENDDHPTRKSDKNSVCSGSLCDRIEIIDLE